MWVGLVVATFLLLMALAAFFKFREPLKVWMQANEERVLELVLKGTLLFVVLQTIMLLQDNRNSLDGASLIPPPSGSLIEFLAFLALDFVQFVRGASATSPNPTASPPVSLLSPRKPP